MFHLIKKIGLVLCFIVPWIICVWVLFSKGININNTSHSYSTSSADAVTIIVGTASSHKNIEWCYVEYKELISEENNKVYKYFVATFGINFSCSEEDKIHFLNSLSLWQAFYAKLGEEGILYPCIDKNTN